MSRTLLTLLALLALAIGLAVAQNQPPQNQPGQAQPMPQTQQPPQTQSQQPASQGQTHMSSQDLQAAFEKAFQQEPELSNAKVKVADDKIELSGIVPSQADKDKVRHMAEANADGRKVVDDDLKVGGGDKGSDNQQKPPMSEKPPALEKPAIPPR